MYTFKFIKLHTISTCSFLSINYIPRKLLKKKKNMVRQREDLDVPSFSRSNLFSFCESSETKEKYKYKSSQMFHNAR